MGREKAGFRDNLELLNEMYPDQGMLGKTEVARFLGVTVKTVGRRGIRFNDLTGRISKADLARQIST